MDISNLAKVFGPTIVAHAVPDPDPMTLLQDTKRQPKVGQTLMFLSSSSNCCMISVISDSPGVSAGRGATSDAAHGLLEPADDGGAGEH